MSNETTINEPVLPEVKMHLYRPNEPTKGRIVRSEVCTASKKAAGIVRHVEIDVSGTDLAGNCMPGQSIGVIPGGRPRQPSPTVVAAMVCAMR